MVYLSNLYLLFQQEWNSSRLLNHGEFAGLDGFLRVVAGRMTRKLL